jgi:hypothetical protein
MSGTPSRDDRYPAQAPPTPVVGDLNRGRLRHLRPFFVLTLVIVGEGLMRLVRFPVA